MVRKNRNKNKKVEKNRNVAEKSETYHRTVSIVPDGNCLFRALSYGLYDTQEKHKIIRDEVVREVTNNWENYKDFIIGDSAYRSSIESARDYEVCMGSLGKFGGHQELQAFSSIYTQVYVEIHLVDGLLACYGNLLTCKKKFSLLFSGNLDGGHYDYLKPCEIVDFDDADYDYADYDDTYEVANQKEWRKNGGKTMSRKTT